MRIKYWSNTKFADCLRGVFGIEKQPKVATYEGWHVYAQNAKTASKIGYFLAESLNTLQNIWLYLPDKYNHFLAQQSNIRDNVHVLRTNTKRGQWVDLADKIPDALMLSVIDFVENECFHAYIIGYETGSNLINRYQNQSRFSRVFFPVKIPYCIKAMYGFLWLNTQIDVCVTKRDRERHPYEKIKAAYEFAKYRYTDFDAYVESGLADLYKVDKNIFSSNAAKDDAYARVREIEKQFNKDVEKYSNIIVRYRKHLWT